MPALPTPRAEPVCTGTVQHGMAARPISCGRGRSCRARRALACGRRCVAGTHWSRRCSSGSGGGGGAIGRLSSLPPGLLALRWCPRQPETTTGWGGQGFRVCDGGNGPSSLFRRVRFDKDGLSCTVRRVVLGGRKCLQPRGARCQRRVNGFKTGPRDSKHFVKQSHLLSPPRELPLPRREGLRSQIRHDGRDPYLPRSLRDAYGTLALEPARPWHGRRGPPHLTFPSGHPKCC